MTTYASIFHASFLLHTDIILDMLCHRSINMISLFIANHSQAPIKRSPKYILSIPHDMLVLC